MKRVLVAITVSVLTVTSSFAGNEDRIGSAGASELLINPWTRSMAWADAGISSVVGVDAIYNNIAGIAFVEKTQLKFNHTIWLSGSGTSINAGGLVQKLSEADYISVGVMSMGFGDLPITTVDLPEGGIGTFTPRYMNFNVGYSRKFSKSIYGGINFKVMNESVANVKATGVAIDVGIRYVTGDHDQMKFGITLKNVGPPMRFKGDGLAYQVTYPGGEETVTLEQRSAAIELPSQLNIGASYDFLMGELSKLTVAAAFSANSFSYDQYRLGLNYGFNHDKAAFNLMAGYVFEKGVFNADVSRTVMSGLTAGASVDIHVGKNKTALGLEYAYKMTNTFNGVHSFGATIDLR